MNMHGKKPKKAGNYVLINGELFPVRGKLQEIRAAGALAGAGKKSAPIEHWNGHQWTETGLRLYA